MYGRITVDRLLVIMAFRHRSHAVEPRRLVAASGWYDWEGRPEPPPDPGELADWTCEGYRLYTIARNSHNDYRDGWPAVPSKSVRRAIRLGFLEDSAGIASLTPSGLARAIAVRADMMSYRGTYRRHCRGPWTVLTRYRRALRKREAQASRIAGAIAVEPDEVEAPPRKQRPKGWLHRKARA